MGFWHKLESHGAGKLGQFLLTCVDDLTQVLEEIAVHEGDPAFEATQMRSVARAALARLYGDLEGLEPKETPGACSCPALLVEPLSFDGD